MSTKEKQIAKIAVVVGSTALLCAGGIVLSKMKESKRKARLEAFMEDNEEYLRNSPNFNRYLERKIATAQFWEIVGRD